MIQAIEDKIIVEEMKRTTTKSGIILPGGAIEPQAYGRVLSVGPAVPKWDDEKVDVKEGDIIVYHKMGGQAMAFHNKIYCCVPHAEVYGILTAEDIIDELTIIETREAETEASPQAQNLIKRI